MVPFLKRLWYNAVGDRTHDLPLTGQIFYAVAVFLFGTETLEEFGSLGFLSWCWPIARYTCYIIYICIYDTMPYKSYVCFRRLKLAPNKQTSRYSCFIIINLITIWNALYVIHFASFPPKPCVVDLDSYYSWSYTSGSPNSRLGKNVDVQNVQNAESPPFVSLAILLKKYFQQQISYH